MKLPEFILVLDTETANNLDDPLTYDIGFAVTDRRGRIYEEHSFIIYDIYRGERDLMQSCYYADKLASYEINLKNKSTRMVSFLTARRIIRQTMWKYNIDTVAAYNADFDRRALNTTSRYIMKSKKGFRWFFPYGTKFWCIWHMACQVICTQTAYQKWARHNGLVSPSGNLKTNAEVVYRYITGQNDFEEEHKGLDDVRIEIAVMAHCFRQHKKMHKHIKRGCWRIPNTKEIKEKFAV